LTDGRKVDLPPRNLNKTFESIDEDAMKELDLGLKIAVMIYKLNMINQPAYYERLVQIFKDSPKRPAKFPEILSILRVLEENLLIITASYGATADGKSRRLYTIDSAEVQKIRAVYEQHVRPHERPEDQIDYVKGLLLEK
jgi:hypothetical protein